MGIILQEVVGFKCSNLQKVCVFCSVEVRGFLMSDFTMWCFDFYHLTKHTVSMMINTKICESEDTKTK